MKTACDVGEDLALGKSPNDEGRGLTHLQIGRVEQHVSGLRDVGRVKAVVISKADPGALRNILHNEKHALFLTERL